MFVPNRKHITSPLRAQQVNSICNLQLYINITVIILAFIHGPDFYLKHNVSEIQFCLCLEVSSSGIGGPYLQTILETETTCLTSHWKEFRRLLFPRTFC
jgi:hypothetical protein